VDYPLERSGKRDNTSDALVLRRRILPNHVGAECRHKEYIQIITEMRGSGSGAAPVACDPATYSNGGAFTQEIAAGGTFTADPITVTDVNGVVRSSLPNIAVVCAWIALSIRNSQGTVIQSVASYPSGAIITIADQTTNVRASDGESLEIVTQIVGASVELTDFEVTAPSYSVTIAARRKIKIVGSVPTSTEIEGEFIAITMPSGGTCDDATYSNGGAFTQVNTFRRHLHGA
jgi:hypothetical protein